MANHKQTKKAPETYEEFLEREWKNHNIHYADYHIPPSNYPFKVGQSVIYGALPDVRVEEILDNGRLLHISYHDRGESYGRPFDHNRRLPRIVWWIDVETITTGAESVGGTPSYLRASYSNTGLDSIIHRVYAHGLIDTPDYQRGYVWTDEDRVRLIDSIFNGFDIGKFVFVRYPYPENRDEVVDGKQRLQAIIAFREGRFAYKGKTWYELAQMDRNNFENLQVQYAELRGEEYKKSDILWLFLSINAGGVPQTEEHISKTRKMYLQALEEESKND
jgi:hypothetical protein